MVAVTLDQVYAAVTLLGRKIDTLITEMGIVMTEADDIKAATDLLNAEIPQLAAASAQIAELVQQLRTEVTAGQIPDAIMDGFDAALAKLTPAVNNVKAIAVPPAG